jgi:hypothetical protein
VVANLYVYPLTEKPLPSNIPSEKPYLILVYETEFERVRFPIPIELKGKRDPRKIPAISLPPAEPVRFVKSGCVAIANYASICASLWFCRGACASLCVQVVKAKQRTISPTVVGVVQTASAHPGTTDVMDEAVAQHALEMVR